MSKQIIKNPVINSDFPDLDVIRVDDAYYMISTTMYYYPGAVILRSFDLVNWEIYTHVFDVLENVPSEMLQGESHSYGRGMWAASLRYNDGKFYVFFTAYETGKSFLYISDDILGPWDKKTYQGVYHDASILFDEGKAYLVYGNKELHLKEFLPDFSDFNTKGMDKIIVVDNDNCGLFSEGAHFYKINNKYYIFCIHWPKYGAGRRTEVVYISDSIDGEYEAHTVFDEDCGYHNCGIAQGGIVETPDGDWYAMLFQDRGAIGRSPYLIPVTWDGYIPVFHNPNEYPVEIKSTRPDHVYERLYTPILFARLNDEEDRTIAHQWEWNHVPDNSLWTRTNDGISIVSGKISANITQAQNILTQRMMGPKSSMSVCVDASMLKEGDYAGLVSFIGNYAYVGISREIGRYFLVVSTKDTKAVNKDMVFYLPSVEEIRVPFDGNVVEFKITADFTDMNDKIELYYRKNKRWMKLFEQKTNFALDFFTGCRFGLFLYSTKRIGGEATFFDIQYTV